MAFLQSPWVVLQIVNSSDLRLSSTSPSGEGISDFTQLVAATAMDMPHVNQAVPKAYVDLGAHMQAWARELLEAEKLPVCTRSEVAEHIRASSDLSLSLDDSDIVGRALDFLAAGGLVVPAQGSESVILDPWWLAGALACAITVEPGRLAALPAALVQRGFLHHDRDSLAAVWPDDKGFTDALRRSLVGLLHRFDLAYEVVTGGVGPLGGEVKYSLVASMLPEAHKDGSQSLDGALEPVAAGESEVGVQYRIDFVPPDLWSSLIIRCGSLVVPEACTRTSAVLEWGDQRALLTLDTGRGQLTLVCRGPSPVELRVRFHWTLVELVKRKYPFLDTKEWLHAMCHACQNSSQLLPRAVSMALAGNPFFCAHCLENIVLVVDDLLLSPLDALDKALSTPVTSPEGVAQLCRLAARMVDTTEFLCNRHGHRTQLWLPVPARAAGGAGAGAGAGSGAATGTSDMSASFHDHLNWVSICENPAGWHICPRIPGGYSRSRLSTRSAAAVEPLLQRVAGVLCVVSDLTGASVPPAWRDWKGAVEPLLGRDGWEDRDWSFLVARLSASSTSGVSKSDAFGRSWLCEEHMKVVTPASSEVRSPAAFAIFDDSVVLEV
jgi:hypothetical protein